MLQLTITKDDQQVLSKVLAPGEYTLGRLEDNDFMLDDRQISRRHARMLVQESSLVLEDLGSSNKLFVNEQQVERVELHPGQSALIKPFALLLEALPDADDKTIVLGSDKHDIHDQATMVMTSPAAKPKLRLVVRQGGEAGREYPLNDGVLKLGRGDDCDILLTDASVSRRHAEISVSSDKVLVKDLGSTGGTFVNDNRIQEQVLADGDTLRTGKAVLEVCSSTSQPHVIQKDIPSRKTAQTPSVAVSRKTAGKGKRNILLLMILALGIAGYFVFQGGGDEQHQAVTDAEEQTKSKEMEQIQRLVAINLVKGKQALEGGRVEEAVDHLQKVVVADPGHDEGGQLLAEAQLLLQQKVEQQQRLEREREALEEKVSQLLASAQQAMSRNDFAQAITHAKQVLTLDADQEEAKSILAKAQSGQQEAQRRQQQAQAAARKVEADAKSAFERGQALRQQGQLVGAVQAWEQVFQVDSGKRTKYSTEAEALIAQVKQELRSRSMPLVESASTQAESDPRGALQSLQSTIKIDPWNTQAKELLERIQPGLVAEGKRFFDEGLVLESLGELRQACEKWRLALEWVPTSDPLFQRIQSKEGQCR